MNSQLQMSMDSGTSAQISSKIFDFAAKSPRNMLRAMLPVVVAGFWLLATGSNVWASITATGTSGYISVANDAGLFYNSVDSTSPYYNQLAYAAGGTNQLKINSSATSGVAAQLSGTATSGSYSNSFWITTNGGKGGNDDIILGIAVTGPISSDFSLTIHYCPVKFECIAITS